MKEKIRLRFIEVCGDVSYPTDGMLDVALEVFKEEIEKVEKQAENTPRMWDGLGAAYQDGWEGACYAILDLFKEEYGNTNNNKLS